MSEVATVVLGVAIYHVMVALYAQFDEWMMRRARRCVREDD